MQDEMRRGYFDDFTDLKETGGRMFPVAEGLAPASTAPAFPPFVVCLSFDITTQFTSPATPPQPFLLVQTWTRSNTHLLYTTLPTYFTYLEENVSVLDGCHDSLSKNCKVSFASTWLGIDPFAMGTAICAFCPPMC